LDEQHRVLKFYGKGLSFLKKEMTQLEKDANGIYSNLQKGKHVNRPRIDFQKIQAA